MECLINDPVVIAVKGCFRVQIRGSSNVERIGLRARDIDQMPAILFGIPVEVRDMPQLLPPAAKPQLDRQTEWEIHAPEGIVALRDAGRQVGVDDIPVRIAGESS